jgi:hypothetical protein
MDGGFGSIPRLGVDPEVQCTLHDYLGGENSFWLLIIPNHNLESYLHHLRPNHCRRPQL